jgi:hypothetical protein
MYYEMLPGADPQARERAIASWTSMGQYEPSILERLVAYTYLALGKEVLWVSRIYTSLFWLVGGLALFDLARRMTLDALQEEVLDDSKRGALSLAVALVAAGYYLFLPFATQASRSFQPDPGMVMWIVLSVYGLYRWQSQRSWKWAVIAGVAGGMAVLTKAVAAYVVGAAALAMVLQSLGLRRSWRSLQVWAMGLLMVAPSAYYYLIQRHGRAADYFNGWTVQLSHLLLEPSFYARWFNLIQSLMGLAILLLALIGVLIAHPRNRVLLLGLWLGYAAYGLFLPYQMYTHSYYHLQLVPIVALSLIPVAQALLLRVWQQPRFWQLLVVLVALAGVVFPAYQSISLQASENHRIEPAYWQEIASYLPTDGKIVALTQDYGYRLMYYGWRKVSSLWPIQGEIRLAKLRGEGKTFEQYFLNRTEGASYFLITAFGQYNDQPDLQEMLETHYPLIAKGNGYLIYDLEHPLPAASP